MNLQCRVWCDENTADTTLLNCPAIITVSNNLMTKGLAARMLKDHMLCVYTVVLL